MSEQARTVVESRPKDSRSVRLITNVPHGKEAAPIPFRCESS